MSQRKINVTVVELSSRAVPAPVGRFDRMASALDDRPDLSAGSGFNRRQGPSRAQVVPGADPYIARLVDRLSRQMAAEEKGRPGDDWDGWGDRLRAEASPPLGDSGEFYGDPH